MKKTGILLALGLIGSASPVFAGECELSITRTACSPAMEAESFKKCSNKQASCTETSKKGTAKACADEALANCQNKRYDVTKAKKVTAKFNGEAVEAGKDFCATKVEGVYDPDKDYPFRNKPECK